MISGDSPAGGRDPSGSGSGPGSGLGSGSGSGRGTGSWRSRLRFGWRQALVTVTGISVSVGLLALFDPGPGPLVLAAVLTMTISRSRLIRSWRGRLEALVVLPFVGLATAGVGLLFVSLPLAGAAAYVVAMFLSVYLRAFGPVWTRVGSLIALPFLTLLIAPGAGIGTSPLEVAMLSLGVLVIVVVLQLIAEAGHLLPKSRLKATAATATAEATAVARSRPSSLRPIASTRMAIQLAIALAAAFVFGALVFPEHVTWVVLTAFIVCSGNRGRADVLYKSGLRIVGATVGTLGASLALVLIRPAHPWLQGPLLVVILIVIIGIGLWLREWTYAAWAVAMTLVITLLQGTAIPVAAGAHLAAGAGTTQLWIRILAIIVGAACGIAASWFVLPVRSEGVVRRRVADALAALGEFADEPTPLADHELNAALERLDEIAPPWAALERISGWRKTLRNPGAWIGLVHESAELVRVQPQLTTSASRALGAARKSMREPDAIGERLLVLRDELRAAL